MKFFGRLFLSGVLVFLAACSAADVSSQKRKMTMTQCKDPRPQMCTMDYSPVCGIITPPVKYTKRQKPLEV